MLRIMNLDIQNKLQSYPKLSKCCSRWIDTAEHCTVWWQLHDLGQSLQWCNVRMINSFAYIVRIPSTQAVQIVFRPAWVNFRTNTIIFHFVQIQNRNETNMPIADCLLWNDVPIQDHVLLPQWAQWFHWLHHGLGSGHHWHHQTLRISDHIHVQQMHNIPYFK